MNLISSILSKNSRIYANLSFCKCFRFFLASCFSWALTWLKWSAPISIPTLSLTYWRLSCIVKLWTTQSKTRCLKCHFCVSVNLRIFLLSSYKSKGLLYVLCYSGSSSLHRYCKVKLGVSELIQPGSFIKGKGLLKKEIYDYIVRCTQALHEVYAVFVINII